MNKIKTLGLTLALCALALTPLHAQVNTNAPQPQPNSGSFFQSTMGFFTSFNTNLDGTFGASKGSLWTSVDSLQGAQVPLANAIGVSYDVYKSLSGEAIIRNGGVTGTVISVQGGLGWNVIVHDLELTGYADGGYYTTSQHVSQNLYAEFGLRAKKSLTTHTYAGVGIGVQLPVNAQVFQALFGFTF